MIYNTSLYESLMKIVDKYNNLSKQLEDPSLSVSQITDANKQLKRIGVIKEKFLEFKKLIDNGNEDEQILKSEKDHELLNEAQKELDIIKEKIPTFEKELKIMLLPVDPYADKNVIIEMRPAAGGDESSIFTADLFEVYKIFCDRMGWNTKIIDVDTSSFGYSYVYFSVSGENVWSKMKFESGVHRVQRIPATEAKGRVHTSTITVAVMPELDEVEIKIKPDELRVDVFRSGGKGGQNVNKVESGVRLTHLPTGIAVACTTERSQLMNKELAMKTLMSKLWTLKENERNNTIDTIRRDSVGTGERSEKIRTYNYPQNRVTDHRIGFTLNKLDYIMQGYLDEIIDALITDEQSRLLDQLKI
ncbi:MAG: peptide chain release factor 1 [Mycoplasmoidaceae bacterium]|nr:MAG: peptide chain release factor 1 [Mycoplasmoidaceae bacterium]